MSLTRRISLALSLVLIALGLMSIVSCTVAAQTPALDAQILALRSRIAAAASANDIDALEASFTKDFTHTHAIGRVDNAVARISALIGGEVTIEIAKPDEISIRAYGPDTAIAIGQTTIKTSVYRWTVVYVRQGGAWKAAASHASPVTK